MAADGVACGGEAIMDGDDGDDATGAAGAGMPEDAVRRPIATIGLLDNDQFALAFLERSLSELMPESRVLWRTTSGRDAVAKCLDPDTAPNVLLTDMSMDELSGPAVCRAVRVKSARVAILAVTSFSLAVYASKAAEAGAQGIVPKSVESPIIDAVRAVAAGRTWDSGTGVAFQNAADAHARLAGGRTPRQFLLSDREAEAMNLCSRGLTTEQIAADMKVGVSTAKTYLARAIRKLGVSSRGQAVALWTGASEGER
ncbi:response regulator transcription factor [Bifidobacterium sp. MA2]|uniref:Response regulator transcription factor n=1 Tax=Bifidobacterium santillanense TaxID=2809028 RepID=A0ABS5UME7_9BIFI|nr:response regulator transcription factor [Bifidobacterium santillanense]MBT1172073.1 response regulator transcription factor [Bifidobacterium santillanense]